MFLALPDWFGCFLLAIAGGDAVLALSPEFFAIALQTPVGQAALFRVVGVVLIGLAAFAGSRWLMLIPAAILLLSFGWEGHSPQFWASSCFDGFGHGPLGNHGLVAGRDPTPDRCTAERTQPHGDMHLAGRPCSRCRYCCLRAWCCWGCLPGWRLDLTQAYQQRMVIKLIAVSGILALAAANKTAAHWSARVSYGPCAWKQHWRSVSWL